MTSNFRCVLPMFAGLVICACASPARQTQSVPHDGDLPSLVHPGDSITYSEWSKEHPELTNTFCVTAVVGDEIHSDGPLTIHASEVQNLTVEPQRCVHKNQFFKEVGRTAGGLVLSPFVLVCMASGGCSVQ